MMSVMTSQSQFSADDYLSDAAVQSTEIIRRLDLLGRERGGVTSVAASHSTFWTGVLARRFHSLAETWRKECAHLSSVKEMVLHPAYQQIVGMGPAALPLIFARLEREPNHWFWALRAITGEDPVAPEHRGNIRLMAQDWLHWAMMRGFVS